MSHFPAGPGCCGRHRPYREPCPICAREDRRASGVTGVLDGVALRRPRNLPRPRSNTLMQRCLRGEVRFDEDAVERAVLEATGAWHDGLNDDVVGLAEYLGLSQAEYAAWAQCDCTFSELVRNRRDAM